jgi:hypothetical protein
MYKNLAYEYVKNRDEDTKRKERLIRNSFTLLENLNLLLIMELSRPQDSRNKRKE